MHMHHVIQHRGAPAHRTATHAAMATGAGAAPGDAPVPRAVIKNVDMTDEMQQEVVEIAADAFVKHALEKDMAAAVKRAVDEKFGPTWHVVVGKSFGSFVTHGAYACGAGVPR